MTEDAFLEEEFTGRVKLSIWGDLMAYSRPYRKELVLLAVFSVVLAVCEAMFPLVTRQIIDSVLAHLEDNSLEVPFKMIAAEYAGLVVTLGFSVFVFIIICGRISTGMAHDIRQAGFERLQQLSFSYFDRRSVGWLVARLTTDSDRLARIISWGLLDVLIGGSMIAMVAGIMVWINWKLALLILVIMPPLAWVTLFFKKRLLKTSREVRKTNSNITASYNEGIQGIRTAKSLVREDENIEEFREATDRMYVQSVRNAILGAMYLPLVLTIGSIGTAVILWAGGGRVMIGTLTIGTLILFLTYSMHFNWPILEIARVFTEMQSAQAAAERVLDLIGTEPEIKDSVDVVRAIQEQRDCPRQEGIAADGHPQRIGEIEFVDVSFAYKQGKPVLDHFNLKVKAGETIALVGPTGGGKTTIVGLMCRFYEPTGGQVRINGLDYRRRSLDWLQSNLGIVLQSPHLFKGTVRENIRYGNLEASDAEIERVARLVNAHRFIAAMEGGYESEVGEGGGRLSTGQKQLVSLARAVLADPQIFVMDEATSSVDTETERLIQQGVEKVLSGRTSFVIAHRLSTIRSADRIVVIDGGRIIEEGSHAELIRRRGRYYELYTQQFTQERQEQVLRSAETETASESGR